MKAIVCTRYDLPDGLQLMEVAKPIPKDNEVLVKVAAASVNASDLEILTGKPFYAWVYRMLRPKVKILGSDIAGQVEAVGKDVTQFRPGDRVFGDIFNRMGGFAEYVCAYEHNLALKPDEMTFEQAAAVPQAAVIALQAMYSIGQVKAGQKVLINGAGGGVGTFAVQLAKLFGAEVTAVDSARKLEMLRSIGADQIIDYAQENFTRNGKRYNLILDVVGNHSFLDYRRALRPKGIYLMVGGSTKTLFQILLFGKSSFMSGGKKMGILMWESNKDLAYLIKLFEEGRIMSVIDRCYPLSQVPEALNYLEQKRARGKIVISVNNSIE